MKITTLINREARRPYGINVVIVGRLKSAAYYNANKKTIKEKSAKRRKTHKIESATYSANYRQAHKERIKEKKRSWYNANKDRTIKRIYQNKKQRRRTDPLFKFRELLRKRTWDAFHGRGWTKTDTSSALLGASWDVVQRHIEARFKPGMTWDNQGLWEPDHIIPLASGTTVEEVSKLCHYTNLQPLWAGENRSKSKY